MYRSKKTSLSLKSTSLLKDYGYRFFPALIICILGVLIYSNSFDCSFHFDDNHNIVDNETIRNISDVKTIWNFVNRRFVGYYTFALNYHFHKLDVFGYHLVNLIIHLIASILVYRLVFLLLSTPVMLNEKISRHKKLIALFCGLLFVAHPVQTQAVTYIVQRLASIAALFYYASMCLYLKARLTKKLYVSLMYFAGSAVTALLGMLTKETVFTLPFAILLLEFGFIQKGKLSEILRKKTILFYIIPPLLFTLIIPYFLSDKFSFTFDIFYRSYFKPISSHRFGDPLLSVPIYLMTQFRVIITYIRLSFFPINQNLDYDFPASQSFFELSTLFSFLALSAIVVFALFIFRHKRMISVGILLFFLMLSVESSIIPIRNVIFEHRLYLPMAGFVIFFVSAAYQIAWKKNKTLVKIFLITVICLFSIATYKRNMVWKNDLTIWTDAAKKSPKKSRTHNNLGESYFKLGMYEKGYREFLTGLKLNPSNSKAYNNAGSYLYTMGKYDEAIEFYAQGLEYSPANPDIHINMGQALVMAGKPDEALPYFSGVVKIKPGYIIKLKVAALVLENKGDLDSAVKFYSEILKFIPGDGEVHRNTGKIYMTLAKYEKSASHLKKAVQIKPGDAVTHNLLGKALMYLERKAEAEKHFSEALRLKPDFMEAHVNLALCLSAQGHIEEADKQLEKAKALINK